MGKTTKPKVKWSVDGKPLVLQIGGHVLCGGTVASYPCHWTLGEILWFDADNVVVKRNTATGQAWTQMICILDIRAFGTIEELLNVRKQAAEGVKHLQSAVDAAESALGNARAALFNRLEELCAQDHLKAIPLNLPAIKQADAEQRAIQEEIETEDEASAKTLADA